MFSFDATRTARITQTVTPYATHASVVAFRHCLRSHARGRPKAHRGGSLPPDHGRSSRAPVIIVERARAFFRFVSSHSPSRLLAEHPLDSVHPARVVHVGVPELLEERLRLGSASTLLSENHHGGVLVGGELRRVHESHVQGVPGGVDGALRGWVVGHLAGALYSAHVQERGFLEAEKRGIVDKACDVRFQREGGRACRWVGEASERRVSMLVSGANRRKG